MADSTPLEDGSTAYYDAAGNLTQIVSRDGSVYAADTTIVADFGRAVAGAFGDAIRTAFKRPASAAAAPAQASTAASSSQKTVLLIGALIVGALILKKLA